MTARLEACAAADPSCSRSTATAMPRAKPLLLLDIDGVLCPIGAGPGEPMCRLVVDEWPIVFSEKLPSRMSGLSERYQLVWATRWEHAANTSLAPVLGLPELPLVSFAGTSARLGRTWKLAAVKRFVRDRPMAWVDDELGPDAHVWAQKRAAPTLLLDVNPARGLAAAHVDLLIRFADRVVEDPDGREGATS
jgi:hypothetical protein